VGLNPLTRADRPYTLVLVGFALTLRGLWLWSEPLAWIAGGLGAILAGFWIGGPR
jgi:hypothetical protein